MRSKYPRYRLEHTRDSLLEMRAAIRDSDSAKTHRQPAAYGAERFGRTPAIGIRWSFGGSRRAQRRWVAPANRELRAPRPQTGSLDRHRESRCVIVSNR